MQPVVAIRRDHLGQERCQTSQKVEGSSEVRRENGSRRQACERGFCRNTNIKVQANPIFGHLKIEFLNRYQLRLKIVKTCQKQNKIINEKLYKIVEDWQQKSKS